MKSNKLKCWLAAVVVAVICCPAALAQQSKIAVASFNRMETDITARVTAPKKDQNGEVCALIRIVTNVKDLMFEPDALGITARENKIGEIWLYVPRGARRISILHDQLGILRNYFYPDIIEKGTVYEMVLNTGDSEDKPVVENNMQFFVLRPEPANANVYVDDEQVPIENGHFISTYDLLRRLPGITITNNEVRYRFAPVMVLLDNVPEENFDFDLLDVDDIKDVFYSPATSVGPLYGAAAGNGAIVVTTKNGFIQKNKMNSNMQTITTLGYQQTVEFYSPAYDTEAKKESVKPDLRSTIYWNPSVQVDESGTVQVSFYTADSAADYGVVIEGVCTSGNLIYSGEKVISRHSDSY